MASGDPGALAGRRVLVVRPAAQGAASAETLRRAGAEPVLVPLIELLPPADGGAALAAAVRRLDGYDWLVLTSANGAERFLEAVGTDRPPPGLRVAAIGPATAAALGAAGLTVSLLPEKYVAESLLEAFPPPVTGPARSAIDARDESDDALPVVGAEAGFDAAIPEPTGVAGARVPRADRGLDFATPARGGNPAGAGDAPIVPAPADPGAPGRVLLVRAAVARDVLPDGLRAKGWSVDVVAAYRAEPRILSPAERAAAATCDTVILTSPSVVDAFRDQPDPLPVPPTVAAIGPVTAAAARRRGLPVHVEAAEHTIAGLVAALSRHAATDGRRS